MALIHCPDCGAQVSESAVVCPQCGFPLRRDALAQSAARGGGSSSSTAALIVGGIVVAGIVGVVLIGILAAIAIPRFAQASARAKEREGETLLRQLYTAENQYYAENGQYTADLGELAAAGWRPDSARYYHVEVRLGDTPQTLVCLEARPKLGTGVMPLSMDSLGVAYHGEGCAGETLLESRGVPYRSVTADELPGEGGDAGARILLREVYQGLVEYRAKNGGEPATLGEVLGRVHDSPASTQYRLAMSRPGGTLCVSAVPGWGLDRDVFHAFSLDGDGRIYARAECSGAPLEQVDAAPPADSAAAGG